MATRYGCKGARVGDDPIAERLRPGRLDVGKIRGAHHRNEDLRLAPFDCRADRRRDHSNPTGNLTGRYATNELQPKHFAHLAHGRSLCWHPVSPSESRRSGPEVGQQTHPTPGEIIPECGATSSRNGGARSSRNSGRHHPGTTGGFPPESAEFDSGFHCDRGGTVPLAMLAVFLEAKIA